ncbi:MAG: DUF4185 domain-containing protein [Ferruginibacter sp.]
MDFKLIKGFVFITFLAIGSCSPRKTADTAVNNGTAKMDLNNFKFSVEEAPEWTNIFKRSSGWFGGDGIFVIPRNGIDKASEDTSTILFSDTMIGEIENGKLKPGFVMIHNSVAILKGAEPKEENIKFNWDKKSTGGPESVFIPKTPDTKPGDYYWLGDGFVNPDLNDNTYIFGYRVRNIKVTSGFDFEQVGNTFIIIPKGSEPPYKDQRQMDVPFFVGGNDTNAVSLGSGIFVNTAKAGVTDPDGYVYVYGVRGKDKNLVAARVLPKDFEKLTEWKFWDGNGWVAEMSKATNITNRVSNELSVSQLPDGRYALFFQVDGISSIIAMRLGSSPVGPFGPIIHVYDCKGDLDGKNIFPYNAKAHPALSKPGELLVSYNVNSFDFHNDIKVNPNLYRPRFIRVKIL